ncbi:MAG: biotin transporter BioY [Clostridiales bacterium]|nr:biotin transporter BioY [Clostridiales bacterium]
MKDKNPVFISVLTALFAAIIAVCSLIALPLPAGVPVTLQTFAIALCGYTLGSLKGTVCVSLYLIIGAVGVPVFSGFAGGPAALFGKTGGFLFGFLIMVFLCGAASKSEKILTKIFAGVAGLLICHLMGVLWFNYLTRMGVVTTALTVSVPFLIKDIVSVATAAFVHGKIKKTRFLKAL